MRQKADAKERGEVTHTEQLRHDAAGGWHRAQKNETHDDGKAIGQRWRGGQQQQWYENHRACAVDSHQQQMLGPARTGPAKEVATENIEQPDQGIGLRAHQRWQSTVEEKRWQVGHDQSDMKAADKVAQRQQHKAAMLACAAQCLAQRYRLLAAGGRWQWRQRAQAACQQHDEQRADTQPGTGFAPAHLGQQIHGEGHHQELSE